MWNERIGENGGEWGVWGKTRGNSILSYLIKLSALNWKCHLEDFCQVLYSVFAYAIFLEFCMDFTAMRSQLDKQIYHCLHEWKMEAQPRVDIRSHHFTIPAARKIYFPYMLLCGPIVPVSMTDDSDCCVRRSNVLLSFYWSLCITALKIMKLAQSYTYILLHIIVLI